MPTSHMRQKFTIFFFALSMFGATEVAHAHASFRDAVNEGSANVWNAVSITHGCNTNVGGEGNGAPHQNVIALSVLFPDFANASNNTIRYSTGTVPAQSGDGVTTPTGTGTVGDEFVMPDLSNDIVGSTSAIALTAALGLDLGGDQLFANTIPIVDGNNNVRGWQGWSGTKPFNGPVLLESAKKPNGTDVSATGNSPFRIGGIRFNSTSCAKSLKIRVAVVNWCRKGADSYKLPDRADVWFGPTTPKFNDPLLMPNATVANGGTGAIYWPTMTVNRNLTTNPLPSTCTNSDYDTVYIEPKPADIDALMLISSAKYPVGAKAKYWPTP